MVPSWSHQTALESGDEKNNKLNVFRGCVAAPHPIGVFFPFAVASALQIPW